VTSGHRIVPRRKTFGPEANETWERSPSNDGDIETSRQIFEVLEGGTNEGFGTRGRVACPVPETDRTPLAIRLDADGAEQGPAGTYHTWTSKVAAPSESKANVEIDTLNCQPAAAVTDTAPSDSQVAD
jgi:hypothetical protein